MSFWKRACVYQDLLNRKCINKNLTLEVSSVNVLENLTNGLSFHCFYIMLCQNLPCSFVRSFLLTKIFFCLPTLFSEQLLQACLSDFEFNLLLQVHWLWISTGSSTIPWLVTEGKPWSSEKKPMRIVSSCCLPIGLNWFIESQRGTCC